MEPAVSSAVSPFLSFWHQILACSDGLGGKSLTLEEWDPAMSRLLPKLKAYGVVTLRFPVFLTEFLATQSGYSEDLIKRLRIHELTLRCSSSFQRLVFIEEDGVLSFGMFCTEWPAKKVAYLDLLESSRFGKNPVRPVLRAYSEYLCLLNPGQQLHIWADAPTGQLSYIFRNRIAHQSEMQGGANARSEELMKLYETWLAESRFATHRYSLPLVVPPLPTFGRKAEPEVLQAYSNLCTVVKDSLSNLNVLFGKTVVASLTSAQPWVPQGVNFIIYKSFTPSEAPIDPAQYLHNLNLDFSSEAGARTSTQLLQEEWKRLGKAYRRYDCCEYWSARSDLDLRPYERSRGMMELDFYIIHEEEKARHFN